MTFPSPRVNNKGISETSRFSFSILAMLSKSLIILCLELEVTLRMVADGADLGALTPMTQTLLPRISLVSASRWAWMSGSNMEAER